MINLVVFYVLEVKGKFCPVLLTLDVILQDLTLWVSEAKGKIYQELVKRKSISID